MTLANYFYQQRPWKTKGDLKEETGRFRLWAFNEGKFISGKYSYQTRKIIPLSVERCNVVNWIFVADSFLRGGGFWYLIEKKNPPQVWRTGWWFQIFFIFTPIWGIFPILTHIFLGSVNLATIVVTQLTFLYLWTFDFGPWTLSCSQNTASKLVVVMGVEPKIGGFLPPKMDGENNGKPLFFNGWLGGTPPIFGNTHIFWIYFFSHNHGSVEHGELFER